MKVLCQVSGWTLFLWFVLLCPLCRPVLAEITFPIAQSNVENWRPLEFDILCGAVGGPINPDPRDISCVCPNDDATAGGICLRPSPELAWESHLQWAAKEFRDLQFHSPDGFGPVISDHGTGVQKVRIYTARLQGASAQVKNIRKWAPGDKCYPGALARMTIDPSAIHMTDDEFIAYLAAHELYHTVQNALPEGRKNINSRRGECLRPKWINEAHADAIAIDYSRKRYPQEFPARRGFAKDKLSGLRPYHWPLHVRFPDQPPIRIGLTPRKNFTAYKTSSFWLHIGDRYRKGDFHFIQDYQINAAPTYGAGKEDWLQWLDRNLLRDQKVKTPLYRVYPGFLTHFLGAWDKGGVGDFYLRNGWTKAAFGKCLELKLSPTMPVAYTEAKLKAMSGRCVSVTINGLTGTQLASVKLAAYTTRQHVDDLHMGFAYTNDRTGFNCGHAVRTHRIPRGKLECLLEPVTSYEQNTGDPDEPATRYWNGILVEPGFSSGTAKTEPPPPGDYLDMDDQKAAEPPESADSDDGKNLNWSITNMYALSLVPPKPSLKGLENPPNVFLKIVAGLEMSGLAIDGQDVNQGGSDGKRTAQRKRSVAASGRSALATNIFTPPSTGYVDDDGLVFSDSMSKELADIRELTTRVEEGFFQSGSDGAPPYPDLRTFRLAEATVTPMGGHPIVEKIEVVREFTVSVLEPLPEDATGTFKAFVLGVDHDNKRAFFSEKKEDVKVTVIENSHDIFRAKVEGRICEGALTQEAYLARAQSGQRWCERQFTISGEVIKPFAYLYRLGSTMVSRETEGEKLYNKYGHNRQDGLSGFGGSQTNGGIGQTGDPSSDNVGDLVGCDCGCANRAVVEVAYPKCVKQCQSAWAACEANPSASADQSTTKQSRTGSKELPNGKKEDDEKQAKKRLNRLEETLGMNFSKLGQSLGVDVTKLKSRSRKERKAIKKALAEKLMKKRDKGFQSAFGMSAEELEKLDKAEQRKIFKARGGMKGMGMTSADTKPDIVYTMPPPMPQGGFSDGSQALLVSSDFTATIEFSSNQGVPLTMVAVDLARQVIVSQSTKSSPIKEEINLREYSVEPTDLLIELVNTETRNVVARYRPARSES